MIRKPKIKFRDLKDKDARKVILTILRKFCEEKELYKYGNEHGIGIEENEECMIALLDAGLIKIVANDEGFYLMIYNPFHDEYRRM